MGFRQNKRDGKDEWGQWLKQHADLIEASGLPSSLFADEDSWLEFIEYGGLRDDPIEWRVDELSLRQKAATLRLIRTRPLFPPMETERGLILDMIAAVERSEEAN